MKNSLFFKILKGYIIIIVVIILLFFFYSKTVIKNHNLNILKQKLKDTNYLIGLKLKDANLSDLNKINILLKDIKNNLNTRITIIDLEGNVIADSDYEAKQMENHINRPEIQQALRYGSSYALRYSTTLKEEMLYFATLTYIKNKRFLIRTSYNLKDIKHLINTLWIEFIKILFFPTILILILALNILYSITKPIKKLTEVATKVAKGNFDVKISLRTNDEIQILAENLNFMIEEIKKFILDISNQRDKIKNIFSSIQEAVVMLNKNGKIVLYNKKFEELCKLNPYNRYFWEVLISSELNDLIKETLNIQKNLIREINIADKFYLCSISFISEEETVILLYDITEHKNLQNIKKELVTNIIHELKTPLTSIRGFAETVFYEIGSPQHKRYLNIIISNTDRLINIINDLTTLSKLEQNETKLELTDTNLEQLINNIIPIFENKLKQKNLNLKLEIQKNLKPIKADKLLIEQLLINLIDNAIKYTEEGYIKISLYQDDKKTYIDVEDTGVGIPKEYHQRIFERFFVVDKARSREAGGTGLGLAIVKHIVLLHKGEVYLESEPNIGSKFKVALPLI